jgi:NitT/TauT family transport system permease protein
MTIETLPPIEDLDEGRRNAPAAVPGGMPRVPFRERAGDFALHVLQTGGALLVFSAICEMLSRWDPSWWPRIILPPPTEIWPQFWDMALDTFVWHHAWVTLQEALLGFSFGAGVAFLLGVLVALNRFVRRALYPLLIGVQSSPRSALAPVFVAWFGFGMSSKVVLAALICFFPVFSNTITGLTLANEDPLLLMRSLRASRLQIFFRLRLPHATPLLFAGIKASVTYALVGAVFGELIGANEGIGALIKAASSRLDMALVFSYLILLSLGGISLIVTAALIERRVTFWNREHD